MTHVQRATTPAPGASLGRAEDHTLGTALHGAPCIHPLPPHPSQQECPHLQHLPQHQCRHHPRRCRRHQSQRLRPHTGQRECPRHPLLHRHNSPHQCLHHPHQRRREHQQMRATVHRVTDRATSPLHT